MDWESTSPPPPQSRFAPSSDPDGHEGLKGIWQGNLAPLHRAASPVPGQATEPLTHGPARSVGARPRASARPALRPRALRATGPRRRKPAASPLPSPAPPRPARAPPPPGSGLRLVGPISPGGGEGRPRARGPLGVVVRFPSPQAQRPRYLKEALWLQGLRQDTRESLLPVP